MSTFLTSISPLSEPISQDSADTFINRIIGVSDWPNDRITSRELTSEITGGCLHEINFGRVGGLPRNDVTTTIKYVPDLMMSALTLTVEYDDANTGDKYSKVFGSSSFDQLGFLAFLQHQLDLRRYDEISCKRRTVRQGIEHIRAKLLALQRVENLLSMHDLYQQLRELGEINTVLLEPTEDGRYIVRVFSSTDNRIDRDFRCQRIIETLKPSLESVISAGTAYDGTTVTLDLTKDPGSQSRDELTQQMHELLEEM
ncbi:hypothetical protein GCM10009720_21320 [Yaniella flava]|uniref:Uncharacterized protein n=1 Tax=Yaniella flava TaxID=287930 RepID=A0ABN2UNB2_9MICC